MHALRTRTRMGRLFAVGALLAFMLVGALSQAAQGEPMWTTYHRDAGRSGDDPEATEPIVPVKAWQSPNLGAPLWSQPLILGSRAYVATVGDKIYALNAATGGVVWEKSAGTPVPSGELPCGDITPTVGIVGTPVIDTSTNAIYAVADTWDAGKKEAHHVLKGYSLTGGEEVLSTTVDPPGSDPKAILQRTALNLDAGRVVFGFGGNDGDCSDYRGTVVAAPESGGSPLYWQYEPAPPSASGGAVWGPSGPAVDGEGHIYASTGNPNPTGGKKAETYDYSDSVVELSSSLSRIGNFEPESWLQDSNDDADLGSSGPELLPGGLLFQAGKNRIGYLIDESKLGEGAPAVYSHQVCGGGGSFGGDAYANGTIYVPCTDGVRALTYNQAARTFSALWQGPSDANGPPIVSAGLVWSVATAGGGGTKLYGIDPATGAPRYTEALPSPVADHFASPSAAGGRLFLATGSSVTAYQIAELAPAVTTKAASSLAQTSATLNATVNPNGGEVTKCEFEYGTTTSYGQSAPCSSLPGSGSSPVAVSASVTGLTTNTTYHFRIQATNASGTSKGLDETFTTLAPALTPHYFSNGVRLGESEGNSEEEGVRVGISWGTLELKGESGAAAGGTVTCHTVAAGLDYNPIGGGAGKGNTETFAAFACQSNICKAGEATGVVPASLPWPSELTGTSTATFRSKTGTAAHPIRVSVTCNATATAPFEGEDQPLAPSGVRKGNSSKAPGQIEFDSGSGELKLVSGFGGATLGTSRTIGSLKTLGYENEEPIQIDPKGAA